MKQVPYTDIDPERNAKLREKLWALLEIVINSLTDYFKQRKKDGKPIRASYSTCALSVLRHNNIVVEKPRAGSPSALGAKDPLGNLVKRLEETTGMAFVYADAQDEEEEGEV
jgi:hypothetical protein